MHVAWQFRKTEIIREIYYRQYQYPGFSSITVIPRWTCPSAPSSWYVGLNKPPANLTDFREPSASLCKAGCVLDLRKGRTMWKCLLSMEYLFVPSDRKADRNNTIKRTSCCLDSQVCTVRKQKTNKFTFVWRRTLVVPGIFLLLGLLDLTFLMVMRTPICFWSNTFSDTVIYS